MAAPPHAITIRRAAEMLGEDEKWLWDMATDMEPEHGRLWIYDTATNRPLPSPWTGWNTCGRCSRDTGDQQTVAFTLDGMEYLREMLPEYKRNRSPPRP